MPSQNQFENIRLGNPPMDPKLKDEIVKITGVRDPEGTSNSLPIEPAKPPDPATGGKDAGKDATTVPNVPPAVVAVLPYPQGYTPRDLSREVDKIRSAKKRIKLDPSAFSTNLSSSQKNPSSMTFNFASKPSICFWTIHDVGESLNCLKFSKDCSLLASGFSESYIRIWNLKGENFREFRSDFDEKEVTRCKFHILVFRMASINQRLV
jgi:transcription initiation factor TFIID subunit 5